MKLFFISFSISCILLSGVGRAQNFPVSTIPDSLKNKAHAVIRASETFFEYINENKTRYRKHIAITVLDAEGNDKAVLLLPYSKSKEVHSISGKLYDADGNKVRVLKNNEIQDFGTTGGENFADDVRYKRHDFSCFHYPYTVEYEVVIENNTSFFFPTWVPQDEEDLSVENSSIVLELPLEYPLRYKAFNHPQPPEVREEKDHKIYTWNTKALPARQSEEYSPDWEYTTETILFAPSTFQLGEYSGSMETWAAFGSFLYNLNKNRDRLPAITVTKVHEMADKLQDSRSKALALYNYMQHSTRYISVQMGIGGWQTAEATSVAQNGYGDCKALVNYTYSLLKEAGIPSYMVLVKAGHEAKSFQSDFPSNQFNHVILCVPVEGDSLWLECTDPNLPGGYLSGFTADRYALMVISNGGTLVHTPAYRMQENVQLRRIKAMVLNGDELQTRIQTKYTGLQQDNLFGMIHNINKEKVAKKLKEELDFPTYELDSFLYSEKPGKVPAIEEELFLHIRNYASLSGKRIFILPNISTRSNRKLSNDEHRFNPILFRNEYLDIDSNEITIPSGYIPEYIPADKNLSSPFGTYISHTSVLSDRILYTRRMTYSSGEFPATQYAEIQNWYAQIYKYDREKVVLVKKE